VRNPAGVPEDVRFDDLASLFLLPAVESLYFEDFAFDVGEYICKTKPVTLDPPYEHVWGPSSSNCSELIFHMCRIPVHFMASFILSCKRLKRLKGPVYSRVFKRVAPHINETLQEFAPDEELHHNTWSNALQRTDPGSEEPAGPDMRFTQLRFVTLYMGDLVDRCLVPSRKNPELSADIGWLSLAQILGNSVHTIKGLRICTSVCEELRPYHLVRLVAVLVDFMQSGPERLEAICLFQIKMLRMEDSVHHPPRDIEPWCGEIRKICESRNVLLHTNAPKLSCKICRMERTWTGVPLHSLPDPPELDPYPYNEHW
jgi:hypothetical protein